MNDNKFAALAHPVRLRIVGEFCGRPRTTAQLARALTDIPQATLYRQIRALLEAGVLRVVAEESRGGAIERTYEVADGAARYSPAEAKQLSAEQHIEGISVFAAALVESAAARLRAVPGDQLIDQGLAYQQVVVHLNAQEYADFSEEMEALVGRMLQIPPGSGRRRYALASLVIPHDEHNEEKP